MRVRRVPLSFSLCARLLLFLSVASSASAVDIDWVTVGGAGNACDTQAQGCFGTVADIYRVAEFEVTNAQYTEFLNAVAATDTNALYNTSMGSGVGGITRSGSSGSYTYSAIAGRGDMPVNYVSFWDATRFANWLHNGQPGGAQDASTTENGAYTLEPIGIANNTITRNVGATVFVTSEDEWYKAAYYDVGSMSYFDYPAGSDTATTCAAPSATANRANCAPTGSDFTDVGSYTGSASPNGTFDQGGNILEINDTIVTTGRGMRGGAYSLSTFFLQSFVRSLTGAPSEFLNVGFRVGSAAPQVAPSMTPLGAVLLASLIGWMGLRRLRA